MAEIQLKREIAQADIEIKAHVAAQDQHLERTRLDHQVQLENSKAEQDRTHQEREFKFESSMRRKEVAQQESLAQR
jgi:hypothetical protein